jgi:hypothetical protein
MMALRDKRRGPVRSAGQVMGQNADRVFIIGSHGSIMRFSRKQKSNSF